MGLWDAESCANKGDALLAMKHFLDALQTYDEAISMDPTNAK